MKNKITIAAAIQGVLVSAKEPMTPAQVFEAIKKNKTYKFGAANPVDVVRIELNRRCINLPKSSMRADRPFKRLEDGRYEIPSLVPAVSSEAITLIRGAQAAKMSINQYCMSIKKPRNAVANALYYLDKRLAKKLITPEEHAATKAAYAEYLKVKETWESVPA